MRRPTSDPTGPDPAAIVERIAARDANAAWEQGQAALRAGETEAALRWLDRACRIARKDPLPRLARASALLGRDPARAAAEFAELAEAHDVRDAWLGLAVARLRLGEMAAARAALAVVLSHHAAPEDTGWLGLANAIAPEGWCALTGAGRLLTAPAACEVALDGKRIAPRAAPLPGLGRARWLQVRQNGADVLGSPIDLAARRRLQGVVGWDGRGLSGWAWHPADPERDPVLLVQPARGRTRRLVLNEPAHDAPPSLLARPRALALRLGKAAGPFRVLGEDGRELPGSPVDPEAETAARPARPPPRLVPKPRTADIVVPVYGDAAATLACLDSVFAARPRGTRVIVIDDATPEPELAAALDRLAARRRILLIRHARNRGFPAAANAGLARVRAAGRDALLLNADTLVAPGFVARLRQVAYTAADIGSVCPLSNDATILSYPDQTAPNPMPDQAGTARLAELAWRANGAASVEIPTAVGFCMYVRHDCLRATGPFRPEVFGRGYGEENDFSLRAAAAGWRPVAAPGVFVAHAGSTSFGAQAAALRARNDAVIDRLYPGYRPSLDRFAEADPLREARRRLDAALWHADRPRRGRALLLITHARGRGTERTLTQRADAARAAGGWPAVLLPVAKPAPGVRIEGFPNLRFDLPGELPALLEQLRAMRPGAVELHHLLGHHAAMLDALADLRLPYLVYVHDYHWFCPRVTVSDRHGRYCGEPDLAGCTACIHRRGSLLEETIGLAALRERSARLLAGAAGVIAPSADAARRMRRHFPAIRPRVEPPPTPSFPAPTPPLGLGRRRVAVPGGLGWEKGFGLLRDLAREAKAAARELEFIVIGHTIDDAALLRTGHVFVTGRYEPEEAVALIRAQQADLALLPSLWPETWSHTLSEAWAAGLFVVAFDLGAPAERIRAGGHGMLLPPGLPAAAINQALLAARW